MKCPYCSFIESKVIDSRPTEENNSIRRRRECLKCGKRFTTYEKIETLPVMIVKKDSTREPYNRSKIEKGIMYCSLGKNPESGDSRFITIDVKMANDF